MIEVKENNNTGNFIDGNQVFSMIDYSTNYEIQVFKIHANAYNGRGQRVGMHVKIDVVMFHKGFLFYESNNCLWSHKKDGLSYHSKMTCDNYIQYMPMFHASIVDFLITLDNVYKLNTKDYYIACILSGGLNKENIDDFVKLLVSKYKVKLSINDIKNKLTTTAYIDKNKNQVFTTVRRLK